MRLGKEYASTRMLLHLVFFTFYIQAKESTGFLNKLGLRKTSSSNNGNLLNLIMLIIFYGICNLKLLFLILSYLHKLLQLIGIDLGFTSSPKLGERKQSQLLLELRHSRSRPDRFWWWMKLKMNYWSRMEIGKAEEIILNNQHSILVREIVIGFMSLVNWDKVESNQIIIMQGIRLIRGQPPQRG